MHASAHASNASDMAAELPHGAEDLAHMRRALALAERGMYTTTPNPRVGCVIVRDGKVVGEGFHLRAGEAHAESLAIEDARRAGHDVRGATMYVTLEPCNHRGRTPPCVDAILATGLARVVAAMADPNPVAAHGAIRLRQAGIQVDIGLLENEARELNIGFVSRMTRGLPWVRTKIAASLDGRTALANGKSQWITGPEARADGHAWRARACAVLTGIGTIRRDDPELTVRSVPTSRQPLRVIVDRNAETPVGARAFAVGQVLMVTAGSHNPAWPAAAETVALPDKSGRVDLGALMRTLASRGINELHVEAGGRLNGALVDAGVVDEILIYLAPSVLGDPASGMFERATPLTSLDGRVAMAWHSFERIGRDVRMMARVVRKGRT